MNRGPARAVAYLAAFTGFGFALALVLAPWVTLWLTTGTTSALALAWSTRSGRAPWGPLSVTAVLAGLGVGLALSLATWGLYPWVLGWQPALRGDVRALYSLLHAPPGPAVALPVLLLVIFAEEVVWRGAVLGALLEARSSVAARPGETVRLTAADSAACVLVAACAYALPLGVGGAWVLVAVALGCGVVWGLLRVMTGGMLAPLLAHLVWDVLILLARPLESAR